MTAALLVIAQMLALWPGGTCPSDYFCAPTVGIYGQIVPYQDNTGQSDIGIGIRSLDYLPDPYLVGHAYTQFWAIVMLRPGDVVYSSGIGYRVTGSYTQMSCVPPARALAALSLQTSLGGQCGPVIVIQADQE